MKRLLNQELANWSASEHRKPLILQGARQVGKTFLLAQFAAEYYPDYFYCNFEEDPSLATLFDEKLDPEQLITNLAFYRGKKIIPGETLIIFDEIQLAERALTSLKYFHEKASQYHIIAAGSLLGVSIGRQSAFPVGKVTFLELFPLNFIEFLLALNEPMLAKLLQEKTDCLPIAEPLHQKLTNYFKIFVYLGGMPEVVYNYCQNRDIALIDAVKNDIHQSYTNDFSKYSEPLESIKISSIWQSIPSQLAKQNKKFKISDMDKGGRFAKYELALEWLRKAGLIYPAYNTSNPKSPIQGHYENNKFKIYYLDTGLLTTKLKAPPSLIPLDNDLYTEYKGALIENYVAKEIRPITDENLYYWTSKSSAEVDFIVEHQGHIIPIEVKSGLTQQKKSLLAFKEKYHPKALIRFSPRNFIRQKEFINLPLYSTCLLTKFVTIQQN